MSNLNYYIVCILIIVLLIYYGLYSKKDHIVYLNKRKIKGLKNKINNILEHENIKIYYDIVESYNITYTTNKKLIHLVIWNNKENKYYDDNTLLYVLIHEITHIICNDNHESKNFNYIEEKLLKTAYNYNYYNDQINSEYPCTDI